MAATYTVIVPLVQVRLGSGGYAHVYEGGQLPAEADPDHVKALLDGEMVTKGDHVPEPQRAYEPGDDPVSVEGDGKPAGKKQARSQAPSEE